MPIQIKPPVPKQQRRAASSSTAGAATTMRARGGSSTARTSHTGMHDYRASAVPAVGIIANKSNGDARRGGAAHNVTIMTPNSTPYNTLSQQQQAYTNTTQLPPPPSFAAAPFECTCGISGASSTATHQHHYQHHEPQQTVRHVVIPTAPEGTSAAPPYMGAPFTDTTSRYAAGGVSSICGGAAVGGTNGCSAAAPAAAAGGANTAAPLTFTFEEKMAAVSAETDNCRRALVQTHARTRQLEGAYATEKQRYDDMVALIAQRKVALAKARERSAALQAYGGTEGSTEDSATPSEETVLLQRLANKYMRSQYMRRLYGNGGVKAVGNAPASSNGCKRCTSCAAIRMQRATHPHGGKKGSNSGSSGLFEASCPECGTLLAIVNGTAKDLLARDGDFVTTTTTNVAVGQQQQQPPLLTHIDVANLSLDDLSRLLQAVSAHANLLKDECDASDAAATSSAKRKVDAEQAINHMIGNKKTIEGDILKLRKQLKRQSDARNDVVKATRAAERSLAEALATVAEAEKEAKELMQQTAGLATRRAKQDALVAAQMKQQDQFGGVVVGYGEQMKQRQGVLEVLQAENARLRGMLVTEGNGAAAAATNPAPAAAASTPPTAAPSADNDAAPIASHNLPQKGSSVKPDDKYYVAAFDALLRTAKEANKYGL